MKTFSMLKTVNWKGIDKQDEKNSGINFLFFVNIAKIHYFTAFLFCFGAFY